ncbi:SRSF protein kinase 3 isoform X2 [Alligator mississippiensis]|uniref:SRSF protein kinase 3 isoform X2 n=1 Tax=Alligator mississippiensis TaxID=8496 RepID=UPI002877664A|nr:SRSF protein kinase 3 isoform X2 [Alligator mississippiensis]
MEQAAEDEGGHHPAQQGDVLHGRYQVLQRLGSGYFATVWLCQDRAEKRHVAVKVPKGGEAFADAAQDEISLLRCVNSMKKKDRAGENIVHLLDDFKMIGVNGFHVCSVFELLGPSLRCLMRIHGAQGLPLPFVKKALLQCSSCAIKRVSLLSHALASCLNFLGFPCRASKHLPARSAAPSTVLAGLHFLHKHCRIIHADIKPENILLHVSEASLQSFLCDADAWNQSPGDDLVRQLDPCDIMKLGVKIADLGSACWTYKPVCKEIQTQPYRALEVLLGLDYSTPADIWSTGCLAFEMVTGERLFDPRPGDCCSLDEDHIARVIELLGSIPPRMALSWKGAAAFFSRRGAGADREHVGGGGGAALLREPGGAGGGGAGRRVQDGAGGEHGAVHGRRQASAKKVVVQGTNAAHLMDLQALALSLELPTYLVRDAGRTQVPAGSCTVLAIMGEEETVNKVTGTLQLLN